MNNEQSAPSVSPAAGEDASRKKERGGRLWNFHFHSIRTRGMAVGTGLVFLTVVMALAAYSLSLRASTLSAARASLQAKAETASSFFSGYMNRTYVEYFQSATSYAENFESKDSLELQFLNPVGVVVISSSGISAGTVPNSLDVSTALQTGKISFWQGKSSITGERLMAVSAPLSSADGTTIGVMRYITSLKLIYRVINRSILTAVLVGLAVLAVVIISNLTFLRTITVPIASLTAMARRIAEGSYGTHVEKTHDDEIGELTDTINDMSQKLSVAERVQTEFISSVSHELRTPLTAITGWSETISFDPAIQGESRRGLEIITREAGRLSKMVEELLEFTRIQDGRFTLHVSTVDVGGMVEDCMFTYSELFRHEGLKVAYMPPEEEIPPIPGDPERLSQVVLNILDNACKYGKNGKRIDVDLHADDDFVYISIRDYGPGIPPAELPNVKQKFYKGSSKERGSGIGLAVCDEIVQRHSGTLDIRNAEGGGVCVTITLPRK